LGTGRECSLAIEGSNPHNFHTFAISLSSLVEQAVAGQPGLSRMSGNVSVPELLKQENLESLERRLGFVVFGFLAFRPAADRAVRNYVEAGTSFGQVCSVDSERRWT